MDVPRVMFEKARAALAAGDSRTAAALAARLLAMTPDQPQVLHLMAVAERRNGRQEAAGRLFRSALDADPANPEIHNNLANLLRDAGDLAAARYHYREAVAAAPAYIDALGNLAQLCLETGCVNEGVEVARRAIAASPDTRRAWRLLGQLLDVGGDPDGAGDALRRALDLGPEDPHTLAAWARLELRRGANAVSAYDKALALRPDDPDLLLSRAASLSTSGRADAAIDELEQLTAARPEWIEAHMLLTKLRIAAGSPDLAVGHYRAALDARPASLPLWIAYLRTLARLRRHEAVLDGVEAARRVVGNDPLLAGFEAVSCDELGDHERAGSLLAALDRDAGADPDLFAIAVTRNRLRTGRVGAAVARAQAAVDRGALALTPYLATAWRLTGDPRWAWLEGDARFVQVSDNARAAELVAKLAPLLRALHVDKAAPYGQTIEGGTQTGGDLLFRCEPEIAALRALLMKEVASFVARLPPADDLHPLLSGSRRGVRIGGSWSVRLGGGGLHVNHVHPDGWVSSALYIAVPSRAPAEAEDAGWLCLGEPPAELMLELPPFRQVEPAPGRLVLFPSFTWHGTRPISGDERLTVAFDLVRDGSQAHPKRRQAADPTGTI